MIRITAETLSGIPSIVYGLFGMLFFVTALHWGLSLLSGAFTLVIMILPLIMRTADLEQASSVLFLRLYFPPQFLESWQV